MIKGAKGSSVSTPPKDASKQVPVSSSEYWSFLYYFMCYVVLLIDRLFSFFV